MVVLSKIFGILSGFLIFLYLSVQYQSGEFVFLYFIISFYGVIENQVFYALKRKSDKLFQQAIRITKKRILIENLKLLTAIGLVSIVFVVLGYNALPHAPDSIDLEIILIIIAFKLAATFFEVSYELMGHGERSFIVKNSTLLLAFIIIVSVDQAVQLGAYRTLFSYYMAISLLSIAILSALIYIDNGNFIERVHKDNCLSLSVEFQFKLLFSTLIGYASGQYLFLMIQSGLEYYKFGALLFVFGNTIIAIASSNIISKRALKEGSDRLFKVDFGFILVALSYALIFLTAFVINVFGEFLYFPDMGALILKVEPLVNLLYTTMGVTIVVGMMVQNLILLQLIRVATHYRKRAEEPIFYANIVVLVVVVLLGIVEVELTPIAFIYWNILFSLVTLIEISKFRSNALKGIDSVKFTS